MIRQLLPSIRWNGSCDNVLRKLITKRSFTAAIPIWAKKMPDRPPPVNEDEFTESYLKGTGPGGQKIVSLLPGRAGWVFLPDESVESNVKNSS